MPTRDKYPLAKLAEQSSLPFHSGYGFMRGTVIVLGDIVGPSGEEPWDCEPENANQHADDPLDNTESGSERTDDLS